MKLLNISDVKSLSEVIPGKSYRMQPFIGNGDIRIRVRHFRWVRKSLHACSKEITRNQ